MSDPNTNPTPNAGQMDANGNPQGNTVPFDATAINLTDPAVQSYLAGAGYVSSAEADRLSNERNEALNTTKESVLNQLREHKERFKHVDLSAYERLASDPERFNKLVSQGYDAYEQGMGGQYEERLNAARSDYMLLQQQAEQGKAEADRSITDLRSQLVNTQISKEVAIAMSQVQDLNPMAAREIERDAMEQLALDTNGAVVVMQNGNIRQTADGAMGIMEWFAEMKDKTPYRFVGAVGSGPLTGDMTDEQVSKLSAADKMALGRKRNQIANGIVR